MTTRKTDVPGLIKIDQDGRIAPGFQAPTYRQGFGELLDFSTRKPKPAGLGVDAITRAGFARVGSALGAALTAGRVRYPR